MPARKPTERTASGKSGRTCPRRFRFLTRVRHGSPRQNPNFGVVASFTRPRRSTFAQPPGSAWSRPTASGRSTTMRCWPPSCSAPVSASLASWRSSSPALLSSPSCTLPVSTSVGRWRSTSSAFSWHALSLHRWSCTTASRRWTCCPICYGENSVDEAGRTFQRGLHVVLERGLCDHQHRLRMAQGQAIRRQRQASPRTCARRRQWWARSRKPCRLRRNRQSI